VPPEAFLGAHSFIVLFSLLDMVNIMKFHWFGANLKKITREVSILMDQTLQNEAWSIFFRLGCFWLYNPFLRNVQIHRT